MHVTLKEEDVNEVKKHRLLELGAHLVVKKKLWQWDRGQ